MTDMKMLLTATDCAGLSVVRVQDQWIVGWRAEAKIQMPKYEPSLSPEPFFGQLAFKKQYVRALIEMDVLSTGPDLEACLNAALKARETASELVMIQVT